METWSERRARETVANAMARERGEWPPYLPTQSTTWVHPPEAAVYSRGRAVGEATARALAERRSR